MPRHPTGNRVNRVGNFTAVGFENLAELFHYVLCLGNCHAITRYEADIRGRFQNIVGVFNRDRFDFALNGFGGLGCAKPAKEDVG